MKTEILDLTPVSPGSRRQLTRHFWDAGGGPKVYLQAALHADEMPGAILLWHLMELLDTAEAEGRITGQISVVPFANPIGLTQWLQGKPQGRQDLETMQNYNRGHFDLAALAGDALEGQLTQDAGQNTKIIRAAFAKALKALAPKSENEELRQRLLQWSHDADLVLDLHCDHEAVMHFYTSSSHPALTEALGRCTGAVLALMEDTSGGNAFDEAHTAPWRALQKRFPDHPIAQPTFATTLEYRGQRDVSDAQAQQDALNMMAFLGAAGVISGAPKPAHPPALQTPLNGAGEVFAAQGGIVTWALTPGAMVEKDQILGHVSDPLTRRRLPLLAPNAGLFFRRDLHPFCLKGQGLAHVAGETPVRSGDLLSN
ncbi:M14 family metallopeptidase [Xinfangfangia sp. CPCC 101601]|uniref:M14 family metallopeptidase n=1 Tax=Pseudogemmobacter lacusdianii TaxID=3069608 RepID=A0ABU0VX74_9RHOB|nr:succinylglutamate desuccinylase/aspartoacylase family protein [Xinfangfangia sp. CPCC 101601]MDQ2066333.1 M14 family metallopeptidase [Xinfangfangia sp. CPCC 101601]